MESSDIRILIAESRDGARFSSESRRRTIMNASSRYLRTDEWLVMRIPYKPAIHFPFEVEEEARGGCGVGSTDRAEETGGVRGPSKRGEGYFAPFPCSH
jgi:hypothetical protein